MKPKIVVPFDFSATAERALAWAADLQRTTAAPDLHLPVSDAAELRDEREADWPDFAALATSASLLERLGETERAEVARIDEALARVERGTYGECVSCRAAIAIDRLEAVPDADRCERCADR